MKFLRKSIDFLLDSILNSMTEAEAIQFLFIFKSKLEESFTELKSTVPSGEINNKE